MESRRIAIIGSGTAGAAAALFLSRIGHKITLFEKVKHPEAVGAGVMLQPSGMSVLRELGLENAILESGAIVERLYATTTKGKSVLDLRYKHLGNDYYGVGIHRGVLYQSLYDAVLNQPINIEVGVDVSKINDCEREGCSLVSTDGREFRGFNLVIVAAGASPLPCVPPPAPATVGNKAAILSVGGNPGTLISGKMVLRLKLL